MPLTDCSPKTVRMIFAAYAADKRSPLSATQRAAMRCSLQDPTWCPSPAVLPDTWRTVARWYERLQGTPRTAVYTLTYAEEPHP